MSNGWLTIFWFLMVGYLIGYYWRTLGDKTVARLFPPS
jgi:hypothetical protein